MLARADLGSKSRIVNLQCNPPRNSLRSIGVGLADRRGLVAIGLQEDFAAGRPLRRRFATERFLPGTS